MGDGVLSCDLRTVGQAGGNVVCEVGVDGRESADRGWDAADGGEEVDC